MSGDRTQATEQERLCQVELFMGTGTPPVPCAVVPGGTDAAQARSLPSNRQLYVLLGLHYYAAVLARYPRSDRKSERHAAELLEMVRLIIEEGIWPDSDLLRYAGVNDRVRLAEQPSPGSRMTRLTLNRRPGSGEIELLISPTAGASEEESVLSVVVLLQGILPLLDATAVKVLDHGLRYVKSFQDEGMDYASPGAAGSMANRAFREVGGRI
jgi:hypothetical protein